jgi:cellulase/cellobiase CelA1
VTAVAASLVAGVLILGPIAGGATVGAGRPAPVLPAAPVEGSGTEQTGVPQPPLPPTPAEPAVPSAAPSGTAGQPTPTGSASPPHFSPPPRAGRPPGRPPWAGPPSGGPPPGGPPWALSARYTTTSAWDTGLIAEITVTNAGDREQDWRVELVLPAGVRVGNAWNARADQRGDRVLLVPPPERPRLRPGESTVLGFRASRPPGAPVTPRSCSVNTRPCE